MHIFDWPVFSLLFAADFQANPTDISYKKQWKIRQSKIMKHFSYLGCPLASLLRIISMNFSPWYTICDVVNKPHCLGINYYVNFLGHSMGNGFISKKKKLKKNVKERKRSWGPFRIYQLISTANPAQFHSNMAGLAVLISL